MCGVCMETSVHQLSPWCEESLFRHQYTSCQTDVWSLYGQICTQDIRLMFGVCMDTSVHKISDWSMESVRRYLYTSCRLMCGICMDPSAHKISDWCVESVWRHLYTRYQTDVWSSLWTHQYTSFQTDVWSLCSDICTPDIRLMCGVCIVKTYLQ
jgi:hypothetical protein